MLKQCEFRTQQAIPELAPRGRRAIASKDKKIPAEIAISTELVVPESTAARFDRKQ